MSAVCALAPREKHEGAVRPLALGMPSLLGVSNRPSQMESIWTLRQKL